MRAPDEGSAATEYLSMIGIFLFVLLICFEAYVSFGAVEKMESATRSCARVASMDSLGAGKAEGERDMPDWIVHTDADITVANTAGGSVSCTIKGRIPLLAKGLPFDVGITRQVEMPVGG